jgi:dihydropteroate synthase
MIADGADIIDVGGESTRPGAAPVSPAEEIRRVVPVIESLAKRFAVPISVDTTKRAVARAALDAGAQIVNDISGLRFEPAMAEEVARASAGLVLMHSRGTAHNLHDLPPAADIMAEVENGLRRSIAEAEERGVARAKIVLDPGIGFGKTPGQNVELVAHLRRVVRSFPGHAILVGTSRKSFIGRLLGDVPADGRLHGTMATVTAAILYGAQIVRVHDVRPALETARVADAIRQAMNERDV